MNSFPDRTSADSAVIVTDINTLAQGIPIYRADRTYEIDAFVSDGLTTPTLYYSKVASNLGNTPASSPTEWASFTFGTAATYKGLIEESGGSAPTWTGSVPNLTVTIGNSIHGMTITNKNVFVQLVREDTGELIESGVFLPTSGNDIVITSPIDIEVRVNMIQI